MQQPISGRTVCCQGHLVPPASCASRQHCLALTDMALITPPAGPSVVLAAHSTVRASSAQIPVLPSANTLPQPASMASIPTGVVSALPSQGLLNQVSYWAVDGSVQSRTVLTDSTYGSSTSLKQPTLTLRGPSLQVPHSGQSGFLCFALSPHQAGHTSGLGIATNIGIGQNAPLGSQLSHLLK